MVWVCLLVTIFTPEITEAKTDGRSFVVLPSAIDLLESGHMVVEAISPSFGKPFRRASDFSPLIQTSLYPFGRAYGGYLDLMM